MTRIGAESLVPDGWSLTSGPDDEASQYGEDPVQTYSMSSATMVRKVSASYAWVRAEGIPSAEGSCGQALTYQTSFKFKDGTTTSVSTSGNPPLSLSGAHQVVVGESGDAVGPISVGPTPGVEYMAIPVVLEADITVLCVFPKGIPWWSRPVGGRWTFDTGLDQEEFEGTTTEDPKDDDHTTFVYEGHFYTRVGVVIAQRNCATTVPAPAAPAAPAPAEPTPSVPAPAEPTPSVPAPDPPHAAPAPAPATPTVPTPGADKPPLYIPPNITPVTPAPSGGTGLHFPDALDPSTIPPNPQKPPIKPIGFGGLGGVFVILVMVGVILWGVSSGPSTVAPTRATTPSVPPTTISAASTIPVVSLPAQTAVTVSVIDTMGGRVSGVTVTVHSPTGKAGQLVTAAGGTVVFDVHNSGTYVVSIDLPPGYNAVSPSTLNVPVTGSGNPVTATFTIAGTPGTGGSPGEQGPGRSNGGGPVPPSTSTPPPSSGPGSVESTTSVAPTTWTTEPATTTSTTSPELNF